MLTNLLLLIFSLPILYYPFYYYQTEYSRFNKVVYVDAGQLPIRCLLADNPILYNRGLSRVPSMSFNEGMLFDFKKPVIEEFWMYEMLFSLDIIFLDENKKIVNIFREQSPCDSDTCSTVTPSYPIRYALELNAGMSDYLLLAEGQTLDF